ncbi:DNA-formamidopyrimidine glycosylase family protein [Streptomyces physcomitrii]|uniref:Fpg/Nei family DNA glycosylase n=1 Tax=Streptomyces physcomitrii TaxID=2724184 RepID=UPI0033ED1884
MPELPDVEAFREVLATCGQGRRIRGVEVRDASVLHGIGVRRFVRELEGRRLRAPRRHGKWLLGGTDGPTLAFHFGMTGELRCTRDEEPGAYDRVLIAVGGGRCLHYRDQRKLKGLWLLDEAGVRRLLAGLGPDAAAVDRADFDRLLLARRGGLKSALTEQSVLAGLGNLLADEILWRAGLHPSRPAAGLGEAERRRLYRALRGVLRTSIDAGRVPPRGSWLTGRRDDPGGACPRCGTALRRGRIAGRGTYWCPRCQPAPA